MNNSYQDIKEYLRSLLKKVDSPLPIGKIEEQIQITKNLLGTLGPDVFSQFTLIQSVEPLTDDEWNRMARELETHFDVEMRPGAIVQGEEQQKRSDPTWWSNKVKISRETYFWSRYKEYMGDSLPTEVINTMDIDTDVIMNNLEDPSSQEFSKYGMVVGHVQSGKTANYAALVCKAADAGYKFIVVIAGGMNNLRNQTQKRMNEAFTGNDKGVKVGVGKQGNYKKEIAPISLTTNEKDFNKQDADQNSQGLSFDNINSPVIIVIKKNTSTLRNVIKWLESQYNHGISDHAVLVIDDESDYASINTKEDEDPTKINERIRKLLSLFKKSAYVAYTATPYANIFIDHQATNDDIGDDLFPKDFIYALDAPTNYFGAKRIFLDPTKKYLVPVKDYQDIIPAKHKKDHIITNLPETLQEAIRLFILNISIRHLRGQQNKHNSMLVHVTRFTAVHRNITNKITEYFDQIKKIITLYGGFESPENRHILLELLKETFDKHHSNVEFQWEIAIKKVTEIIDSIVIREVHTETKIPLEYRDDIVTNAIVIGGSSLSRGYTLEGLSVSYFLRTTIFYDTLMQMGRWFGYRTDYEDLCKIYMTETMFDSFKIIIEATLDLMDSLKEMEKFGKTPKDFGLAVQQHPDSGLQVTARNKLKNTGEIYFEMKLDGHLKETGWIPATDEIRLKNINEIKKLVNSLGNNFEKKKNNLVWKDVDKTIVSNFLSQYHTFDLSTDQFGMRSRMPINFIKEYVNKVNINWDIVLYSGTSEEVFPVNDDVQVQQQRRKVEKRGEFFEVLKRQVSSGNAEEVTLTEEDLETLKREKLFYEQSKDENGETEADKFSRRRVVRSLLKKPILMLHILEASITNEEGDNFVTLPAFGISFPGGINSGNKNIKLKVNSVYIAEELKEEESDD
ncbi:Z1 domain-containing protein [Lysinibacillus antri]|uniref:Endonuclease n=1 Tax=Lysinibacillus antri TaxID=2498145 RepID=A0A3S0P8J5_9BACI|nr:Z1 domain-containing protein [Lysinibacillus antri]RUL53949.1 endonuclease [Lysinibacillus antri]